MNALFCQETETKPEAPPQPTPERETEPQREKPPAPTRVPSPAPLAPPEEQPEPARITPLHPSCAAPPQMSWLGFAEE